MTAPDVLADVSGPVVGLLSFIATVALATLAGVWRLASLLGQLSAQVKDLERRTGHLEAHQDDHDRWHRGRGIL